MIRWTKYVQKDIFAMKLKSLLSKINLKNDYLHPNTVGRTTIMIPTMNKGFSIHPYIECHICGH